MTTLYESILKDLSEQHINKNVYPTPQQAELELKAYSKEKTDWLYRKNKNNQKKNKLKNIIYNLFCWDEPSQ